jgi:uncharacterized membrane protein YheB (UPF0754 family)
MITLVVAPLVGSVIGYITNDIAIRMLFRPHQAKYILGHKVPFTPGIIPKERGRIAASVGGAISANLINKEVLEKNLLSEAMLGKIQETLDHYFVQQQHNPESLRDYLGHYLETEDIALMEAKGADDLTEVIYKKLARSDVGDSIAHVAVAHVMQKMQHFGKGLGDKLAHDGIGKGGGLGDMIGRGFRKLFGQPAADAASQFISALAEPVENALSVNINEMLRDNSKEMVSEIIHTELRDLLDRPMSSLLKDKDEDIQRIKDSVMSLYCTTIRERLPKILEAVDISRIIENRINEMDMDEAEQLIMEVMRKELRAIVWLGAGLGFLMGFVNCLFL